MYSSVSGTSNGMFVSAQIYIYMKSSDKRKLASFRPKSNYESLHKALQCKETLIPVATVVNKLFLPKKDCFLSLGIY